MNVEDALRNISIPKELEEYIGTYYKALLKRSGKNFVGESEFRCFKRFLDMYNSGKYRFAFKAMNRMFKFLSLLIYIDEDGHPHNLRLYPAQRFKLCAMFGLRHDDGRFVCQEAYLFEARRNGKSFFLGAIIQYLMNMSRYQNELILLSAPKGQQASITFNEFCKWLDNSPQLKEQFENVNRTAMWARSKITKNKLQVMLTGAGAKNTMDGFTNKCCITDEWANADPLISRTLSEGQMHFKDRLFVAMSTAYFNLGGETHKKWISLKKALYENELPENIFLFLADPDQSDIENKQYDKITCFAKANPVLLYELDGYTVKKHVKDAYIQKGKQAMQERGFSLQNWCTKQCNIFYSAEDRMICTYEDIEKSQVDFDFESVIKAGYDEWYLGLDFSKSLDLSSVAFTTYVGVTKDNRLVPNGEECYKQKMFAHVKSWMPSSKLQDHVDSDKFAYRMYIDGDDPELYLCTSANGTSIDTQQIFDYVDMIRRKYDISIITITADPYGTAGVKEKFCELVMDSYIEQNQSPKALSQYIEAMSKEFKDGNICFCKHTEDILQKAILSCLLVRNGNGYYSIEKLTMNKSDDIRIDPADALLDSFIATYIDHNRAIDNTEAIDEWAKMLKGGDGDAD